VSGSRIRARRRGLVARGCRESQFFTPATGACHDMYARAVDRRAPRVSRALLSFSSRSSSDRRVSDLSFPCRRTRYSR
jgi:hypothetical protein